MSAIKPKIKSVYGNTVAKEGQTHCHLSEVLERKILPLFNFTTKPMP